MSRGIRFPDGNEECEDTGTLRPSSLQRLEVISSPPPGQVGMTTGGVVRRLPPRLAASHHAHVARVAGLGRREQGNLERPQARERMQPEEHAAVGAQTFQAGLTPPAP